MSGFAGIVYGDGGQPDAKLLERIAERLAFRGPDATQIWTRPGAGLCFTLLRTGPSPQAAVQPCSLDGRFWLLGDVRLDGREDLLDSLNAGSDKASLDCTNEELVLRAWKKWDEQSLQRLTGDFSFAIWDQLAQKVWCVRDLMGARPFFYAHSSGHLVFSNTLDAVRLAPTVSAKLDSLFIGDFLLQSWSPDWERTAFQDIRRLPPGQVLSYSNDELRLRRFASLPIEEPLRLKRPRDYVEQFREIGRAHV